MKNIKKITAVLVFIFLSIGISTASAENNENQLENQKFLTMRTIEINAASMGFNSSITIVDENGKMEEIELKKVNRKSLSENVITINNTLNNIVEKGYELVFVAGGPNDGLIMMTYTFVKK